MKWKTRKIIRDIKKIEQVKEEMMKKINADCACFDKKNGWFFNNEYGVLCKYDVATKEINLQYKVPDEFRWGSIQMSICGDRIFLYPYWCNKLLIFHIVKEIFEEIEIVCSTEKNLPVSYIGYYKNCIYVYLINNAAIVEVNADTLVCRKFELPQMLLHNTASNDIKCVNGSILFPVISKNMILEFEIESRKVKEHVVNDFSGGVYTIVYDGDLYWITGSNKAYVKWDKRTGKIVEKWDLPSTLRVYCTEQNKWIKYQNPSSVSTFPFLKSVFSGDKIWLFPYMANMILQIDVKSGQYKELFCQDKNIKYVPDMKPCELLGIDDENHNMVFSTPERGYCVLDNKTLNWNEYNFKIDSEFLARHIVRETDIINLSRLIKAVCIQKTMTTRKENQYGRKIYGYIMKENRWGKL